MTTTARNNQLPLVSREVGDKASGRTSDAGQVQKSPTELCREERYKVCHGPKCPTLVLCWLAEDVLMFGM